MTSWKSATRSPIAAFPSISTSRTPPEGQGSAVAGGAAGALLAGTGPAVTLTAVGPGAARGAGGVEQPAAPASTPAVSRPGIHRLIHRFAIIR
ncbi:hypothetical protein GCM10010425_26220 [Streptomyces spororaveus]|uniref:Uncharacterized protein n=1 Tax=Streptomyces spororaveus TaxID=284039 RepID=A0ABQ3TIB0_9ACTN|nr:hypothetical protein Sspor_56920 [Streptomyces spororaveus]